MILVKLDWTLQKMAKHNIFDDRHIGTRFGFLVIVAESSVKYKGKFTQYECLCDCGDTCLRLATKLFSGRLISCGCKQGYGNGTTRKHKIALKHGKSGTSIYLTWQGMISRCHNQNNKNYHQYGGRGILVCDSWHKFENFYADMGDKPTKELSLERIENNSGYNKDNVKWGTKSEQHRNKRDNHFLKLDDELLTLSEWSRKTGLNAATISGRLRMGWDALKTLTEPPRKPIKDPIGGRFRSLEITT